MEADSNYMAESFRNWVLNGNQEMKLASCSMPKRREASSCAHNTNLPRKQYRVQCVKEMPQWV